MFVESPHIPPAFCYRCPFEHKYPECNLLCARALETTIRQYGAENIAAFIAEPVVGAALGCVPAPDGYFQTIREICDRYNVLFIADEVMTGWGRTGKMWGVQHSDVTPDIIATAKGMTAGYTPLSAVIARDAIWSVLEEAHSPFKAGHTLNANAVSCAGAIAVLHYIQEHNLVENSRLRGAQALKGLGNLMEKHPILGDVRGRGLMFGFELVRKQETKQPFEPQQHVSSLFEQAAWKRGLVSYACTGTVDGTLGDMILLAPPLVINEAQVNDVLGIIDASLTDIEQQLGGR